jgi:hypothetical protein
MTLREKKKRAAVIAVSCYTQMQTRPQEIANEVWIKMGINRIVTGREMLQRKGKTPGIKPFL